MRAENIKTRKLSANSLERSEGVRMPQLCLSQSQTPHLLTVEGDIQPRADQPAESGLGQRSLRGYSDIVGGDCGLIDYFIIVGGDYGLIGYSEIRGLFWS
ncbi:Anthracycline acyl carrier protein DpsG [Clarias magur]|uniref:Anthracycline acyl carrier protein DpsG n=1 Tax=Clarias magur TaxID=1594786 RepID=A0A8J4U356_CLAMG|nr:Anthracycline acyl carrier protein DpsG [Clarias magur]